ncbi:MSHA biogenesis protein MshJ [Vibrio xiamenensis]|uniref:MSHA biogenesis protein MshJ n=1 Tax=Vibrio xiamenensis TaxID=861298 RepID=A0A1G8BRL0_9VIBR|nr:type II secretion system protein GspM [Vibrio xiamenensis]SDH35845.1 MSHA biogenesis protein MshJ [Vibrio xiamenensis]
MAKVYNLLNQHYSKLSDREKGLVMLCGLVALILGLLTAIIEPSYKNNKALAQQIQDQTLANQSAQSKNMVMEAKLQRDPDADIDQELKQLLKQSQELSEQASHIVKNFITPEAMAHLLEEVLASSKSLHLVSLESLPAKPLTQQQASSGSGYYLHPVRLEMTGSYFAIQTYLQRLEAMKAKYYWQHFEYQVDAYPKARVILQVYTLGTSKEFIGG